MTEREGPYDNPPSRASERGMTFTAVEGELALICDRCGQFVCAVEDGDDLDVIVQTALDHDDECEDARS